MNITQQERDEIVRQHDFHANARDTHERQSAEELRIAGGHQKIMEGLETLYPFLLNVPAAPDEEDVASPRGLDAVVAALLEMGGYHTAVEIQRVVEAHGWLGRDLAHPEAAVRAALNRAHHAGLIVKRPKDGRTFEYAIAQHPLALADQPDLEAAG